jgi:hypothetical protein
MLVPERRTPFHVVGDDVVEEEVVHAEVYFFGFAAGAALASTSVAIIL